MLMQMHSYKSVLAYPHDPAHAQSTRYEGLQAGSILLTAAGTTLEISNRWTCLMHHAYAETFLRQVQVQRYHPRHPPIMRKVMQRIHERKHFSSDEAWSTKKTENPILVFNLVSPLTPKLRSALFYTFVRQNQRDMEWQGFWFTEIRDASGGI